ncbi:hypothetical protein [Bradyrhizobium niftali]|uniref:Uncharacterized protein n=1 Tax=Bradyrhizobium niftali TaxID=2560055 RepID=A0A4Y9L326_9BRAD|nr:hypothetical protein [Bradyrhizobium niftali]TFV37980.1 hypothetical protein E4K65_42615 [Bradyrhizobium niftali]
MSLRLWRWIDAANDNARHRLTRSFHSREFVEPAFCSIALDNTPLLAATDGFWAELDDGQQSAFIGGRITEHEMPAAYSRSHA